MEQAIRRNSFDWKFFPAASFHDRCAERSGLFKVVPEGLSNLFVVKKDLELDHPVCTQKNCACGNCDPKIAATHAPNCTLAISAVASRSTVARVTK
jgi:hypothetical protein